MLAAYQRLLTRRPFLSQSLTAAFLFATGDALAQHFFEDNNSLVNKERGWHDWNRAARMTAYGFFIAAPSTFAWYRLLERRIKSKNPAQTALTRVLLDQCLFAPTFIAVFIGYGIVSQMTPVFKHLRYSCFMEGRSWSESKEFYRKHYPVALEMNYRIWPFVQLLNFYWVPLNYRLLVVNSVAIGWNGFLSALANRAPPAKN